MFPIKPKHIRRVCFATKLYPKLATTLRVGDKSTNGDGIDGEMFCGGRSRNKDLLAFFGLVPNSQFGASTYAQLPLFRRCVRKLVNLIETELETVGAQEVLLPTLIPQKLWHKSERTKRQQEAFNNVYQLTDKAGNELLLGPTFEETITQIIGNSVPPREHELPLLLYQTSQKYRYEPNPRFGLLRSNEFLMNDLYSFDATLNKAKETYTMTTGVYDRIFTRLGLNCMRIESDPGNIGGLYSHEYQIPVSSGEDTLVKCNSCNYSYNFEMIKRVELGGSELTRDKCLKCYSTDVKHMQTLELGHTFMLSDTYSKPLNATIKCEDGQRTHYHMGCYGLGLTRILGAGLDLFSISPNSGVLDKNNGESMHTQMRWPNEVEPFKLGLVTPARRSKQHHGGSSQFTELLVNRILDTTDLDVDIIIEDRDKDGIFKRLAKLQCLGIPNIIVVGKRFLEDPIQVELLKLSPDKRTYEESWFTEEQLYDYIKREL